MDLLRGAFISWQHSVVSLCLLLEFRLPSVGFVEFVAPKKTASNYTDFTKKPPTKAIFIRSGEPQDHGNLVVFGVQPFGCAPQRRLKPVLQTPPRHQESLGKNRS